MSVIIDSAPRVSSIDIKAKTRPEAAYYGTVVYINHLLDLSAQVKSVVKKNQILLRMFSHLIANPTILIHVPFFRNSILGKIEEIEEQIIALERIRCPLLNIVRHLRQCVDHLRGASSSVRRRGQLSVISICYQMKSTITTSG
jgi:hypothetical protein